MATRSPEKGTGISNSTHEKTAFHSWSLTFKLKLVIVAYYHCYIFCERQVVNSSCLDNFQVVITLCVYKIPLKVKKCKFSSFPFLEELRNVFKMTPHIHTNKLLDSPQWHYRNVRSVSKHSI